MDELRTAHGLGNVFILLEFLLTSLAACWKSDRYRRCACRTFAGLGVELGLLPSPPRSLPPRRARCAESRPSPLSPTTLRLGVSILRVSKDGSR